MPTPLRDRLAAVQRNPLTAALGSFGRVVWRTIQAGMRYRVLGLAAESAFFALLSLPPLLFGLAGSIGFLTKTFSVQTVAQFRADIVALASRALSPQAIDQVLAPTLDDVLTAGRVEVVSIGFLLALWSGSRAMSVFLDTVSIMYGHAGKRGIIRARALSFGIYVAVLITAAILLPLVLAGPNLVSAVLPPQAQWVNRLYWPVVLVGSVLALTTLFSAAVPVRRRWRADLPGALLTLAIWLGGSWLLRLVLDRSLGGSALYGPLAAPIAVMMWLYLMALATLIGASFNAAISSVWPHFAGISRQRAQEIADEVTDGSSA
ncbi:YihY/virulence factor BrkB family protein [Aestuariimicrobium ganziense]|uniref:YihY/virulence factor BrkB family protein n=1 Tax=Aestuariimicrobium ganziense TaxID=2773677 RepID=UPI0019451C60|nr:YihY/virulence factor BrkB family protein [Aestuariimicrobium ganziense]